MLAKDFDVSFALLALSSFQGESRIIGYLSRACFVLFVWGIRSEEFETANPETLWTSGPVAEVMLHTCGNLRHGSDCLPDDAPFACNLIRVQGAAFGIRGLGLLMFRL